MIKMKNLIMIYIYMLYILFVINQIIYIKFLKKIIFYQFYLIENL